MEKKQTETAKPEMKIPKPKKKRRWLTVLIVLLVAAGLLFWFVVRPILSAGDQMSSMLYTQAEAAYRDIRVSVSGTSAVEPLDSYRVTALVKGEILEAPFEEGDQVSADDLLFAIDSGDLDISIQRAELALERYQVAYERLVEDIAETEEDMAEAVEDAAEDQVLYAEDEGVIETLYVEEGDVVAAGAPVADIVDRANLLLELPFHSAAVQYIFEGQSAVVTVEGTGQTLYGTVTEVGFVESPGPGGTVTRQVTVRVANPGALDEGDRATAAVGQYACVEPGGFRYAVRETLTAVKSGEIAVLYVEEGDRVYPDQAVYELEALDVAESYEAQLEALRESLEDAARSIRDGELSLQSTRDQLENYTITSPISGTVIEKNYKAGDTLDATTGGYLAVIYDMTGLKLELNVDEVYIGGIMAGQTVEITCDALEGQVFTGRVSKVNINGTTYNGVTTYPVTIDIDAPGDLLPGMNVSAEILVEEAKGVLTVPVAAVGRGNTVRVLPADAYDKEGVPDYTRLEERAVTLGRNDDDYIEITDGLAEGEVVVIEESYTSLMEQMMGMMSGGMR